MKKIIIITTILLLLSLHSFGQPPGRAYTIYIYITLDDSPIAGATVVVTNTETDENLSTDDGKVDDWNNGWYGTNLANLQEGWHYGDLVLIEAWYNGYYGSNYTVLTGEGEMYGDIVNITLGLPVNYTLNTSVNPPEGGYITLNPPGGIYTSGTTVTATAVANESYVFVHWSGDVTGTNESIQIVMNSNKSIVANFTHPPSKPNKPSGPSYGNAGVSYTYSTSATDPDGDKIRYGWDWNGDGTVDEWTDLYDSGITVNVSHSWSNGGIYYIKVKAKDENGIEGEWSDNLTVTLNSPPSKPNKPSGPSYGNAGVSYTYSTSATDPDGDKIRYGWDWNGDGTVDEWTDLYDSGITVNVSHSWSNIGEYKVKVKAKDEHGVVSQWSNSLTVTIGNIKPAVSILSPLNGSFVNGSVLISGKAWDENGNETLKKVEIRIDGGIWKKANGTASWHYEWNTSSYTNGTHTIEARAYDGISYSDIAKINVTVNNEAPSLPVITAPSCGYANASYAFNVSSTDKNGDKIKYGFDWNNDSVVDEWTDYYESGAMASATHSWNKSGEYCVKVKAKDEYGMESEWSIHTITINYSLPPEVSIAFGVPYYDGWINFSTKIYINASSEYNFTIFYRIWNGTWNAWQKENENITFFIAEEGLHYIEYYAVNSLNSTSNIFNETCYVDNNPPSYQLKLGLPNANLSYNGTVYPTIKICTPMWINASDGEGAGVEWLNYSVWWNPDKPENFTKLYEVSVHDNDENDTDKRVGYITVVLHFEEECFHEIKWQMVDYLGHESIQHSVDIAVDATAPTIVKKMEGYVDESNNTWVNCSTPIWINVTDDGCGGGVGVEKMGILVWWNESGEQSFILLKSIVVEDNDKNDSNPNKGEISYLFEFWQECFHEPEFWAIDYVGNNASFKEKDLVDCTPPASRVADIIPYNQTEVPINITVVDIADYGCENIGPVGVCKVEVYYMYSEDNETWPDEWTLYAVNNSLINEGRTAENWTLQFTPAQTGYYRFISIAYDFVGNTETKFYYDSWCFFNLSYSLSFGEPKYAGWISLFTPINISGEGNIYYRIYNNGSWHPLPGSGTGIDNKFYLYEGNFSLDEYFCEHGQCYIEYYGSGISVRNISCRLDAIVPHTSISTPFLINHPITINCSAYDDGSGIAFVEFYYQSSFDNETWSDWTFAYVDYSPPYQWNFSMEEGFYRICSIGIDNVNNIENMEIKDVIRVYNPDLNDDGAVNVQDLVMIAMNFGKNEPIFDIDGNGEVNIFDIVIIMQCWT